jgi:hypothetical protein
MGCVTATAKRRRRQAVGGWKNVPTQRRPHYATHTTEVWDRLNVKAKERQQQMQARKAKKGTRK